MSDLERSDSYYRKICMLEHGYLPKQTEINERLGNQLSRVFFESCLPALKPYLGLCPALGGPEGDLWVSPSDLLIGKVKLKPPLTRKHIQALTHQGILAIGEDVEKKFIQEFEDEKERALVENEEMMRYLAEKEKRQALAQLREEERLKREEMAQTMREEFKEQLEEELRRLEAYLEEQKLIAVEEGKRETERIMQEKLELAVQETVLRLTRQFAIELIKQSECLHKHFWYHIKQERKKLKKNLADQRLECQEKLQKLHSELQCENIANIMFILAKERRRCMCEKQQLEQNFLARLFELEKELEENADNLQKTTSEMERLGRQVEAREQAMFEIIKQFQKFIYFVLKAVPTQAEYLLNVEKLMIFELTNTIMETRPQYFEEKIQVPSLISNVRRTTDRSLVYPAFHSCENGIKYIPSAVTLDSGEDLPGFVYNESLYVREDFRNMISQGLEISKSNELWNFALQDLQSSTSLECNKIRQSRRSSYDRKLTDKNLVNVRFSQQTQEILLDEKVLRTTSFTEPTRIDSLEANIKTPARVSDKYDDTKEDYTPTGSLLSLPPTDDIQFRSRISLARDSIEIMKRRSLVSIVSKDKGDESFHSEIKITKLDSKLLAIKKSHDSKIESTRGVINRGKESKLELAVDSVLLMKSNATLRSQFSSSFVCKAIKKSTQSTKTLIHKATQVESVPKVVTVSHVEIIDDRNTVISFHDRPKIIPPPKEITPTIPCEKLPRKWVCSEEIYKKPSSVKVLGDPKSTAHLEYQDEFVAKRVNSFITIFRNNPSLRRLFTEVKNK